jgi:microcompartment protein CcmK/EutM
MRRAFALLFVLAALAAAAACGGDSSGEPAATATPTSSGDTATPTGTGADVTAGLRALVERLDLTAFKATYDLATDATGALNGELVLASQPPARLLDYDGSTPLGAARVVIIDNGGASFLCLAAQGQQSCARSAAGGPNALGIPFDVSVDELVDAIISGPDVVARDAGTRRLAEAEARCFDVTGSEGSGTLCFDARGVPLLVDGQFAGSRWTIRATALGEPSAADFEPPFPLTGR